MTSLEDSGNADTSQGIGLPLSSLFAWWVSAASGKYPAGNGPDDSGHSPFACASSPLITDIKEYPIGLPPVDCSFDFKARIFESIHHAAGPAYDSDNELIGEADSPLTPLSDSESSRPDSPTQTASETPVPPSTATTPPTSTFEQPNSTISEPLTRAMKRKAKKKEASRKNKKKKKTTHTEYHPKPSLASRQVQNATSISSTYNAEGFNIVSTGYIAQREKGHATAYRLDQVIGPGSTHKLKLKEWDGRSSIPLLDQSGLIIGICAGKPSGDNGWNQVQLDGTDLLENARPRLYFEPKETKHRRGSFPALAVGISHGGGQSYPKILAQAPENQPVIEELLQAEAFKHISGFATGTFCTWAPQLYEYQRDYLSKIIDHDKELRRRNKHPNPEDPELCHTWPNTPWAATTLNFGPQTVCYKHADFRNLAYGWCSITALGEYNYKKGGHLILWELGWVIEFPPGSTILIPSSTIHHSNVRIQSDERRYSFTQYSAGGIFRWIDNSYKKVEVYLGAMGRDEKAATLKSLSKQLDFSLSMYSTLPEIQALRYAPCSQPDV